MNMQRVSVVSSNITRVGYDEDEKVLEVMFNDGGVYRYVDVEPGTWENLQEVIEEGGSVGRWFHSTIKDSFEFEKVPDEEDVPEE